MKARRISIVIPVFEEACTINHGLEHLINLPFSGQMEIIVVDAAPSPATIGAIRRTDVTKIVAPRGRGPQMNRGAATAAGDILLFLHADTRLPRDGLESAAAALRSPRIVGGAFRLEIASPNPLFRVIEGTANLRTRLTRIPYGDQALFFDRRFFQRIGGFSDIRIMEDVELMQRVKKGGHRIRILPSRVRTSARRWQREGIVRCTLRNWLLVTRFVLGSPPDRLARHYR
ncbi:MAG: TIGR04283 family arsenosugar biosynthesis glycosyltransferase [Desulfobacterales bacterium]